MKPLPLKASFSFCNYHLSILGTMETEQQQIEYKSIRKIQTGDKGFKDLSVTCVALANAEGGMIHIGIEDNKIPPPGQSVSIQQINDTLSRMRSLCHDTTLNASGILKHPDGGEYFILYVSPTRHAIATTSDGKIYRRMGDKCEPVRNEDLSHLIIEKGMYQWELQITSVALNDIPTAHIQAFAQDLRKSDRIREHVRQMTDEELLYHYHLVHEDHLTHLGVLWLGTPAQRARLCYPITVQYIVYGELERKVRKVSWHDNDYNPKQLLLAIEQEAVELRYAHELPDGLFRKQIPHYHPKVLRELLINAVAHKSYALSRDILIEVYPDRLEISNPGGLPQGITKDNILHTQHRRNPKLIHLMSELQLMEGEGSGYDLIYQLNSLEGKCPPIVDSQYDETRVTLYSKIQNPEVLPLLDYILQRYELPQKCHIALGAIAQVGKMPSTQLATWLQLPDGTRIRPYVQPLLEAGIIQKRGNKKATSYFINPQLIAVAGTQLKTSLKTIEPHRLKALIIEDLRLHPKSSMAEIASRLPDVEQQELKNTVYAMTRKNEIQHIGGKKNRRYTL